MFSIDPECPDLDELNDSYELNRETVEYDPQPYLEEIEDSDCTD